jgi:predicted nuclease with TOPRIM domain
MQDELVRLERLVMQEQARLAALHEENAKLRGKIAKQRNEIGRLTQVAEKLSEDKAKLLSDVKWMRRGGD